MPLSRSLPRERESAPGETQSPSEAARDVAEALHRAGMGSVAAFVLRAFRPLGWVGGQALWAFQPFLGAFGMTARRSRLLDVKTMAGLLEQEDGIDELLHHLDAASSGSAARRG